MRDIVAISALLTVWLILLISVASAHQAPTGWAYPWTCCSNNDCRVVNESDSTVKVAETPEGYRISTTGEVIPYNDKRVKDSPDGLFHWCSRQGKDDTPTICLYVPPRML